MNSITNEGTNTLSATLKDILPNCDRIDALVGYFYFSGFKDLYKELSDKKIRILVGMDIDKKIVERVSTFKGGDLDSYVIDTNITTRTGAKNDYVSTFSHIFNDSDDFDNKESTSAFELFLNKIKDGTLEIKKTSVANHSKFYILHNKTEFTTNGITPGIVIEGSSNLTFSGLKGQGERNRMLYEPHYYKDDVKDFERFWNDPDNITIVDIQSADVFIEDVKKKIWLYALPEPKLMYYKVLSEYFGINELEDMKTPNAITGGKFSDLKYQKDAINSGIDRINKFGGVIIADVVGLGKSVVASAIAHNMGLKTIIIAPPHLEDQWNDYMSEFNFGGFVYSTGKIAHALERHENDKNLLIVLDEAHKHRNEDTENYKLLHRLCAGNKVMSLSATPFNNDPKDIYALIKLFSTPGQSTIRTVENLSMSFYALFKQYKAIRRDLRKSDGDELATIEVQEGLKIIATELRKMIEPLIIRRSRLDLEEIVEYKQDLIVQNVAFAKVRDPELLEYDLGDMQKLYVDTLEKIAPENSSTSFIGARYKVASYLNEGSVYVEKLFESEESGVSAKEQLQQIKQAQVNIAKFMRRLLVRRFESSVGAFKLSLDKMINSTQQMLDWYTELGEIPIYKKGSLPEVESLSELEQEELEKELNKYEEKGLIRVPVRELQPGFKVDLEKDIELLKSIQFEWLKNEKDPKYEYFKRRITDSLRNEPFRKIVVFTEFSDTADYLNNKLQVDNMQKIFKYSSKDASLENKRIIRDNFDAGLDAIKQKDDYRAIFKVDKSGKIQILMILNIKHRKEVYSHK